MHNEDKATRQLEEALPSHAWPGENAGVAFGEETELRPEVQTCTFKRLFELAIKDAGIPLVQESHLMGYTPVPLCCPLLSVNTPSLIER